MQHTNIQILYNATNEAPGKHKGGMRRGVRKGLGGVGEWMSTLTVLSVSSQTSQSRLLSMGRPERIIYHLVIRGEQKMFEG